MVAPCHDELAAGTRRHATADALMMMSFRVTSYLPLEASVRRAHRLQHQGTRRANRQQQEKSTNHKEGSHDNSKEQKHEGKQEGQRNSRDLSTTQSTVR